MIYSIVLVLYSLLIRQNLILVLVMKVRQNAIYILPKDTPSITVFCYLIFVSLCSYIIDL